MQELAETVMPTVYDSRGRAQIVAVEGEEIGVDVLLIFLENVAVVGLKNWMER